MRDYYCYVYYDEQWQAYYVGKGCKYRKHYRQDRIPVADAEHTQYFVFKSEWEAYECEIELIKFWGRMCDGGTLLNLCTGGPGAPSRPYHLGNYACAAATKRERVYEINQAHVDALVQRSSKPVSLQHIETDEIHHFSSAAEASRQLNLSQASVRGLRSGRFTIIKGWKLCLTA